MARFTVVASSAALQLRECCVHRLQRYRYFKTVHH